MNNGKLLIYLIIGLIVSTCISIFAGKVWISPMDWLMGEQNAAIIIELRLPRTILAIIIGAALSMAGAAMQGFLRNPLADPGLFGISSSAALGAVLSIFIGFNGGLVLPVFALFGAVIGMLILTLLAGRSGSIIIFTLAGLILSSLTGSLTALLISLAPNPFASSEIITWLMGAIADRSWYDIYFTAPLVIVGMLCLLLSSKMLNALTLGQDVAVSMGINVTILQYLLILGIGLTVGASVAVTGIIGFVGLIIPHLMRPFTDERPSSLLIPSAIAGAILILLADSLIRVFPTVSELRLGIAMSLLGAPFFLGLLFHMRRKLS